MPLVSLFITLVAFAISANAVAPLISTLAGTLGVPASLFGLFITLQFAAFSLASFLGGFVKERFRLTNYHLVASGLVIISAAFFVGTVALRSPAAIIAWVVPLGLAGGATETFSSIQISALSASGSSKSLCMSQVFYTIGAFAAPQIVYLIFAAGLDWRTAFVIFGLFSTAVLVFFLVYNARTGNFRPAPVAAARTVTDVASRGPLFVLLLLLMLGCVLAESLSAAWLPFVFESRFSLLPRDASLLLVTFWVGMMIGRLVIVFLPTRWTLWPTLVACSLGLLATGIWLVATPSLPAQVAGVALFGIFLGPAWPVIVMTASSTFRSDKHTSIIIGVGAIGFASGPLLGSLIVSQGWTGSYFVAHLALAVLIAALCLTARALRPAKIA